MFLAVVGFCLSVFAGRSADTSATDFVYVDLIQQFSQPKIGPYGAYFLEMPVSLAIVRAGLTNVPIRIEVGTNNVSFAKRGIVDKKSGKGGVLFWSRLSRITATNATVSAGWHSGPESAASYRYDLARHGRTNWIIVKRTLKSIS